MPNYIRHTMNVIWIDDICTLLQNPAIYYQIFHNATRFFCYSKFDIDYFKCRHCRRMCEREK